MNELTKNFSVNNSFKYLHYAIQDGTTIYVGGFTNKGRKLVNPSGYRGTTLEYNSTDGARKYKLLSEKANSFNGTVDNFNEAALQGNYLHADADTDSTYAITPFNFFGLNCKADKTLTDVNKGDVIDVVITPDDGFYFTKLPFLKIKNSLERDERVEAVREGNSARITYTVNNEINFLLVGFAEKGGEPAAPVPVSSNVIECTAKTPIPETVNENTPLIIELTAVDGAKFKVKPFLNITKDVISKIEFNVSEDLKTANITHLVEAGTKSIHVEAIAERELVVVNNVTGTDETHTLEGTTVTVTIKTKKYTRSRIDAPKTEYKKLNGEVVSVDMDNTFTLTQSIATATIDEVDITHPVTINGTVIKVIELRSTLSNCTSSPEIGKYLDFGKTVSYILTANENTEFHTDGSTYVQVYKKTGGSEKIPFNVNPDKNKATINYSVPVPDDVSFIQITGECFPKEVIGENYGSINVYKVSMDNLEDFADMRFSDVHDLGSYVNRIKRVYIDVPVLSTDVIKCGNYNTNIQVYQPKEEYITLDFGTITIPHKNNNTADYESEINIFIPFKGFVNIPVEYVGKEISLICIVNIVTGDGVAKLSSGNNVFQIEDITPSQDVIFRTGLDYNTIGGQIWNEMLLYGTEPFINFKWYESANKTGSNNDYNRGEISGFTGLNSFTDISTISTNKMLTGEQERIYRLLEQGAIIE